MKFAKHYCQHCYHAGDEPCPVHGRREMTPEEINKAIAERVMGWSGPISLGDDTRLFFNPAERIDHAWMVVEKFNDFDIARFPSDNKYICNITVQREHGILHDYQSEKCDTAPMAICLAALEAVGGERCQKNDTI